MKSLLKMALFLGIVNGIAYGMDNDGDGQNSMNQLTWQKRKYQAAGFVAGYYALDVGSAILQTGASPDKTAASFGTHFLLASAVTCGAMIGGFKAARYFSPSQSVDQDFKYYRYGLALAVAQGVLAEEYMHYRNGDSSGMGELLSLICQSRNKNPENPYIGS
jgi:hypothetical protein